MDYMYLCAKFRDCTFSHFCFIVRRDRQNDTKTPLIALLVDVSNECWFALDRRTDFDVTVGLSSLNVRVMKGTSWNYESRGHMKLYTNDAHTLQYDKPTQ